MNNYVITNGLNYLGKSGNNWCVVGIPSKAEKFTLDKANKCLKNSMPKWMKTYSMKVEGIKRK